MTVFNSIFLLNHCNVDMKFSVDADFSFPEDCEKFDYICSTY